MIVGNGLLATPFQKKYRDVADVTIFASGVSNSGEVDTRQFKRESSLLATELARTEGKFIYFSTCSIGDPGRVDTPYVEHKMAMEALVKQHPKYFIFRLPQVVGKTLNPYTLTNYIYEKIRKQNGFRLWRNAMRNIIDVDEVYRISNFIIDSNDAEYINSVINVANPRSIGMLDLVKVFEKILVVQAVYEVIEAGADFLIDTSTILHAIEKVALQFDEFYVERVIGKYYANRD